MKMIKTLCDPKRDLRVTRLDFGCDLFSRSYHKVRLFARNRFPALTHVSVTNVTFTEIFMHPSLRVACFNNCDTEWGFHVSPPQMKLLEQLEVSVHFVSGCYGGDVSTSQSFFAAHMLQNYAPHLHNLRRMVIREPPHVTVLALRVLLGSRVNVPPKLKSVILVTEKPSNDNDTRHRLEESSILDTLTQLKEKCPHLEVQVCEAESHENCARKEDQSSFEWMNRYLEV